MADTIHVDSDDATILDDQRSSDPDELAAVLQVRSNSRPSHQTAWATLAMQVPNERPTVQVVSFVECALVELTHEPIGAVYRSNEEWGTIETITVHNDWTTVHSDKDFVRYRRDPRVGTRLWTSSWPAIREAFVERLTRDGIEDVPDVADSFAVHPLSTIERWR